MHPVLHCKYKVISQDVEYENINEPLQPLKILNYTLFWQLTVIEKNGAIGKGTKPLYYRTSSKEQVTSR